MTAWFSNRSVFSVAVVGSVAAVFGLGSFLTSASGETAPTVTHSDCGSASPCLSIINSGTGEGLRAIANNNSGINGSTRASTTLAMPTKINAGVRGFDTSAQVGPENFSSGLLGFSVTGFGMFGFSKIHAGVVGQTNNPSTINTRGSAGVEGFDQSIDGGQNNVGVEGGTFGGSGVFGFSTLGNGVRGITGNPSSTNQQHRAAVFGIDVSTDGGGLNFGVAGFSPGTGVAGISVSPPTAPGAPLAPAVAAYCENGGAAIQAADGFSATSNLLMTLDCLGNLTVKGTIISGAAQVVSTKAATGADVAAYSPRQTEPTIEDFGEGQMNGGRAHVDIQRDFAAVIDRVSNYMVFITPEGDNRGLYVMGKTASGFDVRESQGGTSSIAFAYRIVAKPFGDRDARLPLMSAVIARQTTAARRTSVRAADVLRLMGASDAIRHEREGQIAPN